MTATEAEIVLDIMRDADTCCPPCAYTLMHEFVDHFGYRELAMKRFFDKFDWLELPKEEGDYWYD